MLVTEIKRDKKHLTRLSFSDGGQLLLDNDVLAESGICVNTQIDAEALAGLEYQSDYKRAKSRALWYLDRMDHTEKQLYEKLIRAGFSKKASAEALAWLTEFGLVDDSRYAKRYAERLIEGNASKREAIHKMLAKGISYDMAKEVLAELDADEEAMLKDLIERKYAYKLTTENGAEKVYAALVRKGFSYSSVRKALREYVAELEVCEEF